MSCDLTFVGLFHLCCSVSSVTHVAVNTFLLCVAKYSVLFILYILAADWPFGPRVSTCLNQR